MFGPYFWVAIFLATLFGTLIGNSDIPFALGCPLVIAVAWLGGKFSAHCDFDRDRHNRP